MYNYMNFIIKLILLIVTVIYKLLCFVVGSSFVVMKQDSDETMKKDPAKTLHNISNLNIRNKSQSRRDSVDLKKKKKTPANQLTTTGPIKKALRHWRSPSNPVDWSKSAWSVNSSLIGADEKEASQPTLNRNNSSNSNMRMTNVRQVNK